ncbi:hypothetical protein [Porticoccus sp.]|uniref:hypothetical protein n=1 Tax=Porticoccus sp. TaxID=2024853 RepID=UPI000C0C5EE3|nr:MAG: hypothetical protein COB19_00510 [Porticoccus sp.]
MNTGISFKKLIISTAVASAVSLTSLAVVTAQAGFFISDAAAASDKATAGHKGSANKGSGGQGGEGKGGLRGSKHSISDLLAEEDDGEDSDRPSWAGTPGNEGKPGGGNAGGSTKKGGDYGDIIVMLRYDDGTLVQDGNITYAVASDGSLITITDGEIPEGADVQAVEFGRLNIARSPEKVLDHALTEALSKLDGGVVGDTITLDSAGRLVTSDGSTIDSPLENLALYEALLSATAVDGVITLSVRDGDVTYSFSLPEDLRLDLAASAISGASDKTGELTIDEIVGISTFLGVQDELAELVTDESYTYDRAEIYTEGVLDVWILVEENGVYVPTQVDLFTTVEFNTVEDNSIKDNSTGGIDLFTQQADDAVQVLEYVHDNAIDQ